MIAIPYKGVPPKDEDQRVNRIPKRFEKTILESDPEPVLRGPDLPLAAPNGFQWCPRTLEWWDTWRRAPQSKLLGKTDWETMFEAAFLHNELWRPRTTGRDLSPTAIVNYLAELRRRVGAFGATWEDRQKLQLMIEVPQTEEEAEARLAYDAQAAVDYASRLNKYAAEESKKRE